MDGFTSKLQMIGQNFWERLPEFLITLLIGFLLVELAIFIFSLALRASRVPKALASLLYSLTRAFLWVVLFLVLLQKLGLDDVLVAVTGSSVIVALFISTGVAPLVTDTLSGLSLAADRNFQPGAKVQAGDKGTVGHVVGMTTRKTRIRTSDGKIHVIPNSVIDKNEWVVLKTKGSAARSTRKRK
ncbi:MAG: mechanosensitive ion channel family protein [bacterium]|nr:mechanosensitive ion channel family protein [bacterium]